MSPAQALAEYDRRNDTLLVPTARALVDNDGDLRRPARALAVHVNTLKYRLKRIEQITGIGERPAN